MKYRRLIIALIAAAVVLSAAGAWYWSAPAPPAPSAAVLERVDPDVRAFIEKHRSKAGLMRRSISAWGELAKAYDANNFTDLAGDCYRRLTEMEPGHARWWYGLARAHHEMGQWPEAMAAIDRALEAGPDHAHVRWRKGMWLYEQGRMEDAGREFREVLERWPGDETALLGMAQVHLALRQFEEAVLILKRRELLDGSKGPYVRRLLGFTYTALGDEDQARQFQDPSLDYQPVWEDEWTMELGRYRKGLLAETEYATQLIQSNRPDEAVKILERLREKHPEEKTILTNLAKAHLEAGHVDRANAALAELSNLAPDDPGVLLNLAKVAANSGDSAAANRYVEQAIELDATFAPAYRLKGILAERAGRMSDAVAAYETAAKYDARDPQLFISLGDANAALRRWASASEHYQSAVERDPSMAAAWAKLAEARWALGRDWSAKESLLRAMQLDPDDLTVRRLQSKHNITLEQPEQ